MSVLQTIILLLLLKKNALYFTGEPSANDDPNRELILRPGRGQREELSRHLRQVCRHLNVVKNDKNSLVICDRYAVIRM
jgi:hypothetical protein